MAGHASDITALSAASLFNVDGLNILITGGGSGLGSYMARTLAINGANKVFIIGRREESLNKIRDSLPEPHRKAIIPIVGDVTSKTSLRNVYDAVTGQHATSTLDVLICNSGVTGPRIATKDPKSQQPLDSASKLAEHMLAPSEDELTDTYAVNLTGIHLTVGTFLPLLEAANRARPEPSESNFRPRPQIITTASIGAYNRVPLGSMTYGPSKAGVVHLTKQLASTLIPYDIRANVIAPGLYYSEMTEGMYKSQGRDGGNKEGTWPRDVIPATRGGDEADMGGVVLWLCSRAGAYTNGCVVVTDGGRLGAVPNSY